MKGATGGGDGGVSGGGDGRASRDGVNARGACDPSGSPAAQGDSIADEDPRLVGHSDGDKDGDQDEDEDQDVAAAADDRTLADFLNDIAPPTSDARARPRTLAEEAARFKPCIDGYAIDQRIGEGGMATVWRATQLSTRRVVAVKLMSAGLASERARVRFDREVQLTASLEHPNIARVFDSGVNRGIYFYAMELIRGEPADDYVTSRQLDRRQVVELMRVVATAVAHAHQHGVIHRDLKPANILVSPDGQPHVLDFGLARATDGDGKLQMSSGERQIAGTPAFMSPEQAAGKSDLLGTPTDVYSLGVILFKLLTGEWTHEMTGTQQDVLRRVRDEEVRRPRSVRRDIDRELEAVLLKALARRPEDRYASATELAADLHNYLRGEPLLARPPTIGYLLRTRLRKHAVPLALAGVALGLLLAGALVAFPRLVAAAGVVVMLAVVSVAYWQVRRQRDAAVEQRRRTQSLLRINEALSRETDLSRLWDLILTEARALSGADAGSLFRCRDGVLEFVVAQNRTLDERRRAAGGAILSDLGRGAAGERGETASAFGRAAAGDAATTTAGASVVDARDAGTGAGMVGAEAGMVGAEAGMLGAGAEMLGAGAGTIGAGAGAVGAGAGTRGGAVGFSQLTVPLDERSIAGYVAVTGTPVNLPDARRISSRLPFQHDKRFDARNTYETRSILAVPLKDPRGQVLGVLELINCLDGAGRVIPFSVERQALTVSLASMAAVAIRLQQLLAGDAPADAATRPS